MSKLNGKNAQPTSLVAGRNTGMVWLSLVAVLLLAASALPAFAASGTTILHNTPGYVASAKLLGSADRAQTIEVSIWLQPHNRAALDALATAVTDPKSPNYRQFLTHAQFAAQFAPTAAEAKTVQQFFESHNLKVVTTGPDNFFVRARGNIGDVESAFRVQLNEYKFNGHTLRANNRDPFVEGAAAPLVRSISGLDNGGYEHPLAQQRNAVSLGNTKAVGIAASHSPSGTTDFYSNNCFNGTETDVFSNNNDGSFPIATYTGNHLNLYTVTSPGCAYTPPEIQTAYNLDAAYKAGMDGTGQTIGIIDWCGSSTIMDDANAYSTYFGLPALTSSNFSITYLPSASTCVSADQVEINIDVEWAHAIAPGANINLLVPPSATFQDIDQAWYIAIDTGLANVLSGSYGAEEMYVAATELQNGNLIAETGDILGIGSNFSSGDDGNYTFGFQGIPASVSYPADTPYSTSVGGVSLALNADNSIAWQDGWGSGEILLAETGYVPDPPINFGFAGGAGGGPSTCAVQDASGCVAGFPKPPYQKKVPGKFRQVPDVSWLADPYTGAVIYITVPGDFPSGQWQSWGGTSVACPMFAGMWAIANQAAGYPLGQAAPYLYTLPAGAILDVVPQTSKTNVKGTVQEASGTNTYSPAQIAGVTGPFVDAIWDYAFEELTGLVITFGTDPGLTVKKGWDNVTGVGTPNGMTFVAAFQAAK